MAINSSVSPRFVFGQGTPASPFQIQIFSNERYVTFLQCFAFSGNNPKICDSLSNANADIGYSLIAPAFFTLDLNKPSLRIENTVTIFFIGEARVYIQ